MITQDEFSALDELLDILINHSNLFDARKSYEKGWLQDAQFELKSIRTRLSNSERILSPFIERSEVESVNVNIVYKNGDSEISNMTHTFHDASEWLKDSANG